MNSSSRSVVLLFGRVLLSWIFLYSSVGQVREFSQNVSHVAAAGMPLPQAAIVASILIQSLCGLAILLGFKIRVAAWVLFVFLIPTTLVLHKFWGLPSPHVQEINFFKNMGMMGGLLFAATSDAGAFSLDALLAKRA